MYVGWLCLALINAAQYNKAFLGPSEMKPTVPYWGDVEQCIMIQRMKCNIGVRENDYYMTIM